MAHLLKGQKNEIFELIKATGLPHTSFDWIDGEFSDSNEKFDVLVYKDSSYYFQFAISSDNFQWKRSPGISRLIENGGTDVFSAWDSMIGAASKWLESLKIEVSDPDLWENLPETSDSLWQASESDINDSMFTVEERKTIVQGIQEIREFAIETGMEAAEIKLLDGKLDYLVESSSKLSRKDWILVVSGTLLSIATSQTFDSSAAKAIFEIAGKAFNQLYQGMLLLPQ